MFTYRVWPIVNREGVNTASVSLLLSLLVFRLIRIPYLIIFQLTLYSVLGFCQQNLHLVPSKEKRIGSLQLQISGRFITELEVVPLIVLGLFKVYFPIDFVGGSVEGQLTRSISMSCMS